MSIDTTMKQLLDAGLVHSHELRDTMPQKPKGFNAIRYQRNSRALNAMKKFSSMGLKVFALVDRWDMLIFVSDVEARIDAISDFIIDSIPDTVW